MSDSQLTVFAFSPAWGLPSSGPFALKLIAWMRLAGLAFDLKYEDNSMKGPKGKNPWIEIDGQPMGDSELIIQRLSRELGVSLDEGLTPEQVGRGVAIRRLVEEHLHQVFEYEFIVHDDGYPAFQAAVRASVPGLVAPLVSGYMRSHFRKQLTARGVIRHAPDEITAMGIADIDALEALLGDRDWFVADHPTLTDCSVFGLLSPVVCSGLPTPVCTYARGRERLVRWVESMKERIGEADEEGEPARLAG